MNDDTEDQGHTRFTGAVARRSLSTPASPLSLSSLPQEVDVHTPDLHFGGGQPFSGTMTGDISLPANALLLVTPDDDFLMRGLRLSVMINTTLAAGAPGFLGIYTNRVSTTLGLIATIAPFASEHCAGTVLAYNALVDLREGQGTRGLIYLAGSRGITSGVIEAHGQLYGTEVSGG